MKTIFFFLFSSCLSLPLFAEDSSPVTRQQNVWQPLAMIGVALLFFYMILWRPEQRRRKKMQEQRNAMQKGDRVTAMGIVGTLVRVEKETAILKMVDGSKIEVLLGVISDVKPGNGPKEEREAPKDEDTFKA